MKTLTEKNKHDICQHALALKKNIEVDFLSLGAMLSRIQKERLWEAGWESWVEYTMELKMSPSVVSRLINIYEVFAVQYGIAPAQIAAAGGYSVVAEYLPLVGPKTSKEVVEDWLTTAASLSRQDVRRTILEAKKGVDMAKCEHPNAYIIRVCPDCGNRDKIHEEELS